MSAPALPAFAGVPDWRRRLRPDGWTAAALVVALLFAVPMVALVVLAFGPTADIWSHLAATVLPRYVRTTVLLMAGVGIGTLAIGISAAWFVTMCRFPGRRLFEFALLLPMAVPAYVIAYVYTDLLEYAGPVQGMLRDLFGWQSARDYWFPEIRSLGGAALMMSLVLYPYVYLLARAAFVEQSVCVLEVSRALGRGPWRSFFEVALPLARPAIVVGVALALMEVLNDYGTVDFFAVPTFTIGIFDVWRNMSSIAGAAQLSLVLLAFVAALIGMERWARRGRRFHHTSTRYRALPSYRLRGWRAAAAFVGCAVPVALGFVVPALVLAEYAWIYGARTLAGPFLAQVRNSLLLALIAAGLALAVGLVLAYGQRLRPSPLLKGATRFASLGYAVPGAVLAVAVIVPLAQFDNGLDGLLRRTLGFSSGLLLSGTLVALFYAYVVRFLALAYGSLEAGLAKITPDMDGAARTLGHSAAATLRRVHLPLLRGSTLAAGILVFVDVMKELPMTIILRPFNFETLATHVHQFASRELLGEAALGALAIVAAGILPVLVLGRAMGRSRPGHGALPVAAP